MSQQRNQPNWIWDAMKDDYSHEQRHRAAQQGDKAQGPRRRHVPNEESALMLVAARLKYVANSEWGSRRYLDASLLKEQPYRRLAEFVQTY